MAMAEHNWRARCDWCGWPLHEMAKDGCTAHNCSSPVTHRNDDTAELKQHVRKLEDVIRRLDHGMRVRRVYERCPALDGLLDPYVIGQMGKFVP